MYSKYWGIGYTHRKAPLFNTQLGIPWDISGLFPPHKCEDGSPTYLGTLWISWLVIGFAVVFSFSACWKRQSSHCKIEREENQRRGGGGADRKYQLPWLVTHSKTAGHYYYAPPGNWTVLVCCSI